MEKEKLSKCCKPKEDYKGNNFLVGLAYGIIPHIGCIMFIIGSILGVTILMQFFRPLLMNRYIFHYLILISLGFATLSSCLYLKKNNSLSIKGIKSKKGYLSIMYGSTIGVNLVLFFFIFPLLANISLTGAVVFDGNPEDLKTFKMSVNIPCPGHAPLISNEVKTIEGVIDSRFSFPNNFEVNFDSSKTNINEILSLEVFNQYPATITEEEISQSNTLQEVQNSPALGCSGGCGGGCGSCTGGCGGW